MTAPTCPVHQLPASTAYAKHGCRCDPCTSYKKQQNAKSYKRRRPERRTDWVRSPNCPETGKRCSTAYGVKGCRCFTCRAWNADHTARKKGRKAKRVTSSQRMKELMAEADAAFRTDPGYAILMAIDKARLDAGEQLR